MKKIDIENMSIKYYENSYIYVIEIKENNYYIKRIKCIENNKEIEFIKLNNNTTDIKKMCSNSFVNLSSIDKLNIINSIFDSIQNNKFCNDIFNVLELKKQIYNSLINIVIANENIGLSTLDNIKYSKYIDIVLLDNNEIIGNISIDNNNLNIEVDDFYYEQTIKLLENYFCLFKNNKKVLKKLNNLK